jgi:2-iminobutanoate/2-iminopropanoate deaminase
MKSPLHSVHAPQPIGPYTQAIRANDLCFSPGRLPSIPRRESWSAMTPPSRPPGLKNIRAILTAAGLTFDEVVKTTIFLKNMEDFVKVNEVYGQSFEVDPPARSTVAVAALPMNALVEIEVIAMRRPSG